MRVELFRTITNHLRISRFSNSGKQSQSLEYSNFNKWTNLKTRRFALWKSPRFFLWRNKDEWGKVRMCPWIAGTVLLLNTILAVVAVIIGYSKKINKGQFEMVELYQGSCDVSNRMATVSHLLINVLSTVLLGVSNYTMQCLCAPSRADVERAHQKHEWLDIGTFSIRNLGVMNWKRRILWGLLLFSSAPIHMVYNSVMFRSISVLDYGVFLVPNDLSPSEPLVGDGVAGSKFHELIGTSAAVIQEEIWNGTFHDVTLLECVKKYDINFNNKYNTDLSTVILTADRQYFDNTSSMAGVRRDIDFFDDGNPSIDDIEQDIKNGASWEVMAGFWSYRVWNFTSADGHEFSITGGNRYHPLHTGEAAIAYDLTMLHKYLYDQNPSARSLRKYLDTKSHWENSSWAAEISFTFAGYHRFSGLHSSFPVTGCKYKTAAERCQVFFSVPIAITGLGCNIVKVICMILAARMSRTGIFLTIGDSMASFLNDPDPTTKYQCLLSQVDVAKGLEGWSRPKRTCKKALDCSIGQSSESLSNKEALLFDRIPSSAISLPSRVYPRFVTPTKKRWYQAVTWRRWVFTSCFIIFSGMTFGGVFAGSILVSGTVQAESASELFSTIWSLGFGSVNSDTLMTFPNFENTMVLILLSNSPQFFLSIIYFLTNGLLTCMVGAAEWDRFAFQRRPLRVSWPRGEQTSSLYLTLPYRYGVPNLITFALIHWVVSESLFFVNVQGYNVHGLKIRSTSAHGCCFSALPSFISLILMLVGLIVLLSLGLKRFKTHAPLVTHCSAAISASCHPPYDDPCAAFKPLMWGQVAETGDAVREEELSDCDLSEEQTGPQMSVGLGLALTQTRYAHCTLTSKEVQTPQLYRLYC